MSWLHAPSGPATVARAPTGSARGSTVTLFALTLPVIMGAAAVAVDYSTMAQQRTKLQAAADAAALDAARELHLAQSAGTNVAEIASNYARAHIANTPSLAA